MKRLCLEMYYYASARPREKEACQPPWSVSRSASGRVLCGVSPISSRLPPYWAMRIMTSPTKRL